MLQKYRIRAAGERPSELRRHPEPIRYTLVAAFCWQRRKEIIDGLVDLLIQIVHRIGARAERKVVQALLEDLRKVHGKTTLLYRIAEAAVETPDGIVAEVLYPIAGEQTLRDLVREFKATGPAYQREVHTSLRSSYGSHYRRMLSPLLETLVFRSNNAVHRPVIDAIAFLKARRESKQRYFSPEEGVPIDGVVRSGWKEIILEKDKNGVERINRINYEIAVLQALRDRLRCKEIWVVGADRYRNPDEDLPADFEARRGPYYEALGQPRDADAFVAGLQQSMRDSLDLLERDLPRNRKVKIIERGKGRLSVSPLEPQPEPVNLAALKAEITRRWPMTHLLDVLKETDLRVGFTDDFRSVSPREVLDREELQKRLLLCLYGLGTNTGLKRVSASDPGHQLQGPALRPAPVRPEGLASRRHRPGGQRHLRGPPPRDLGRGHDRLRLRLQEVRGLGPEPHDRVARPLRRAGRDDLLARGAEVGVHLLAAETLLLLGGRRDDRGRAAPLHGDGGREELRR